MPVGPGPASEPQEQTGGLRVTAVLRDRPPVSELLISGSHGPDDLRLEDQGGTLTATVNGQPLALPPGEFEVLVIRGESGQDRIWVGPGVSRRCLIYGGSESDSICFHGTGPATLVTIGGGRDSVAGNGSGTIYWCDGEDGNWSSGQPHIGCVTGLCSSAI